MVKWIMNKFRNKCKFMKMKKKKLIDEKIKIYI